MNSIPKASYSRGRWCLEALPDRAWRAAILGFDIRRDQSKGSGADAARDAPDCDENRRARILISAYRREPSTQPRVEQWYAFSSGSTVGAESPIELAELLQTAGATAMPLQVTPADGASSKGAWTSLPAVLRAKASSGADEWRGRKVLASKLAQCDRGRSIFQQTGGARLTARGRG